MSGRGFLGLVGLALGASLIAWTSVYDLSPAFVAFALIGAFAALLGRGLSGAFATGLGVFASFFALSALWYAVGLRTFLGDPEDLFWWAVGPVLSAAVAADAMLAYGVARFLIGRRAPA